MEKTSIGFSGGGQANRFSTNIIKGIPVMNNDGSHGKKERPTQKPVALMEYLIKTYTNEGETVLDFTARSFTTGVACVNLSRKFIGVEMNKNYFEIAKKCILGGKLSSKEYGV